MEARAIGKAPRIYALDLTLAGGVHGLEPWLDHAHALGFDHILLPIPFPRSGGGTVPLVADHSVLAPEYGGGPTPERLGRIARQCRERGLALLIDVVLDRVAAGGAIAKSAPDLFTAPDPNALPDPRRPVEMGDAALTRLATAEEAQLAGHWWGRRIAEWHQMGLVGARLLGSARVPQPALTPLLHTLRAACPEVLLIGWTPGLSWEVAAGLAGDGLDGVVPSLPWWDWRSEWLWREMEVLGAAGRLIACPEPPGGPRLAAEVQDPSLRERMLRRALVFCATLTPGWLMPMGFEFGLSGSEASGPTTPEAVRAAAPIDLSRETQRVNTACEAVPVFHSDVAPRLLSGPGAPVIAALRTDAPDPRRAGRAALILANADLSHRQRVPVAQILSATIGCFTAFAPLFPADGAALSPAAELVLAPGETRIYAAGSVEVGGRPLPLDRAAAETATHAPRLAIEDMTPRVEDGHIAVKRVLGEAVAVEADLICDGHDMLGAVLLWREPGASVWQQTRMRPLGNDRWQGHFPLQRLGRHEFTVQAWRDAFASFRDELAKKHAAGVDTHLEVIEGRELVAQARGRHRAVEELLAAIDAADAERKRAILLADSSAALMAQADDRPFAVTYDPPVPVDVDRATARFASWYEVFPRSLSDDASRHGTFDDVIRHLPRIRGMGFDVLYFPPIHPIGRINRKGRNNALRAAPDDPGSPYAIGSTEGGHDAIHPELGTLDDFRRLIDAAGRHELEIALDFAIQCAPDHPWLREHKDWFAWRPDGSLRYAENPPKKYEDIVNVDFYAPAATPELWIALANVVLFWCAQGVRIFRVDNPHTKPLPFWEWLIAEVRARHPDAIFLAEAFTRPKLMYRLAKVGFSQSYTYFTWRNTKRELADYLVELATTAPKEFFRPNFFVNTPDINPIPLQTSGRTGFLTRAALAATLSGLWGVYNGFELCEARPLPGREEYADSEKYQIRTWDWERPGNIRREIAELNRIRRMNPALQTHLGVSFLNAWNEAILYYEKATEDRSNVILVAVSLDPQAPQEADFELPLWKWKLPDSAALDAEDLLTGDRFAWHGKVQHLRLTPDRPYAIWRVRPLI